MDQSQSEKIIKEFLTKMATQDNRATAAPYFYVIRTKVSDPAPLDNCDRTCWYWNDSTYDTYELLEEAVREAGYDKDGKAPLTYDLMKKLIDGEAR